MTLNTVRDYFLKAGASLRRSELWRKTFENEEGHSQVLRSGRFGVGMLAAFLLGEEINVETRHVSECDPNKGIAFSAQLDSETIELQKIKRPIGTTIRVCITGKVKDELLGEWNEKEQKWKNQYKWDWYCLTDPKVELKYGKEKLHQEYQLPPFNSNLPPGWHRISHPDYQDVQWTYSKAPHLTCNGIRIIKYSAHDFFMWDNVPDLFTNVPYLFEWNYYNLDYPHISIFDYNANLPLNLQRTELTQDKYPFYEELCNDVLKDFIAYVFVNAPIEPIDHTLLFKWISKLNYPEETFSLGESCPFPWFFTKHGISFVHDLWHTSQIDARYALIIHYQEIHRYYESYELKMPFIDPGSSHAVFLIERERRSSSKKNFAESLSSGIYLSPGDYGFDDYKSQIFSDFFIKGKRTLISRHVLEFIDSVSKFEKEEILSKELISQVVEEWRNENWVLWRLGECPSAGFDFVKFAAENDGKNYEEWPCIIGEWYFKDKNERPVIELSPFGKIWRDTVGSPIIPFDLEERRRMKAYKELKPYIEAHEKMKQR